METPREPALYPTCAGGVMDTPASSLSMGTPIFSIWTPKVCAWYGPHMYSGLVWKPQYVIPSVGTLATNIAPPCTPHQYQHGSVCHQHGHPSIHKGGLVWHLPLVRTPCVCSQYGPPVFSMDPSIQGWLVWTPQYFIANMETPMPVLGMETPYVFRGGWCGHPNTQYLV